MPRAYPRARSTSRARHRDSSQVRAGDGPGAEFLWYLGRVDEVQQDESVEHALHAPELAEHLRRALVERGDEPFFRPGEEGMDDCPLMRVPGLAWRLDRRRELRAKREVLPQTVGGAFRDGGAACRGFPLEPPILGGPEIGLDVSSALRHGFLPSNPFTVGFGVMGSPLPAALSLALLVAEPPDEAPAPVLFHLVPCGAHVAPGRDLGVLRSERHDLAPGVHDRVALAVLPSRVAHEPPAEDEPVDRLNGVDHPNVGLHRLPPLLHERRPGERHEVADAKLSGSRCSLGGGWLGNVVEATVGALQEEVAAILKFVGPAGADEPPRDASPDLELRDHERHPRVREVCQVSRAALDDVAGQLRLTECRLHPRQEPPRARADLFGEASRLEELQAPEFVGIELAARARPWHRLAIADDPAGVRPPQERAIEFGELRALRRLRPGREDLAVGTEAEALGRQFLAPVAQAGREVVPGNPQCTAVEVSAPHQQVHVRGVGVVVIDCDPFQAGPEITLHVADKVPSVRAEVEARRVLG